MNILGIEIERINHDCFKIKGREGKIIYIDPFKIEKEEKADVILITHEHYDHCSIEDINKIVNENTVIVATQDCVSKLMRYENNEKKIVRPKSKLRIEGLKVEAYPAYNTNKFRSKGIPFHPKEDEKVGYLITIDKKRIYHCGDSDFIEEMNNLDIDILLIPVSGTYVMTAAEAAEATKKIKPRIAIPMHYGSIIGSKEDAEKFKNLVEKEGIKVEII